MSTFNGITFTPLRDSDGWRYPWKRAPYWAQQHYPDTNTDEVQFGGLGNPSVTVEVLVDVDADVASLEALVNGSAYTLANFPTARPTPTSGCATASSGAGRGPRSGAER